MQLRPAKAKMMIVQLAMLGWRSVCACAVDSTKCILSETSYFVLYYKWPSGAKNRLRGLRVGSNANLCLWWVGPRNLRFFRSTRLTLRRRRRLRIENRILERRRDVVELCGVQKHFDRPRMVIILWAHFSRFISFFCRPPQKRSRVHAVRYFCRQIRKIRMVVWAMTIFTWYQVHGC